MFAFGYNIQIIEKECEKIALNSFIDDFYVMNQSFSESTRRENNAGYEDRVILTMAHGAS